jgi:hypothetical protein
LDLPDEDEMVEIIKQAIREPLHEPFILLEKRIISGLKIEKAIAL